MHQIALKELGVNKVLFYASEGSVTILVFQNQ